MNLEKKEMKIENVLYPVFHLILFPSVWIFGVLFLLLSQSFLMLFVFMFIFIMPIFLIISSAYEAGKFEFKITDNEVIIKKDYYIYKDQQNIGFSSIRELKMKQGPLQRMVRVGTIIVYTFATGNNTEGRIYDIENHLEVYEMLKERVYAYQELKGKDMGFVR